jgi:hypothetical protein
MCAQQVGAEPVDEQHRHPPGAAERGREAQRVSRQVAALDRDVERRRDAGQDVGQGGRAVLGPDQVPGQGHGRVARTCRPVAMSR